MTGQEAIAILTQLSPEQRREVFRAFNDDVERKTPPPAPAGSAAGTDDGWADFLSLCGCDSSDFAGDSSDKYQYLRETTKPRE